MGQTVNLLSFDFGGSNPSLPTLLIVLGFDGVIFVTIFIYLQILYIKLNCGSSSVDRALAFQAEGRGFEPRLPL